MSTLQALLWAYLIVIIILVHCSLFFCEQHKCLFKVDGYSVLPVSLREFLIHFFSFVPIHIEKLQILAHLMVFGEVILLATLLVDMLQRTIKTILAVTLLALLITFIVYWSTVNPLGNNLEAFFDKIRIRGNEFLKGY